MIMWPVSLRKVSGGGGATGSGPCQVNKREVIPMGKSTERKAAGIQQSGREPSLEEVIEVFETDQTCMECAFAVIVADSYPFVDNCAAVPEDQAEREALDDLWEQGLDDEEMAAQCPYFWPVLLDACAQCKKPINEPRNTWPHLVVGGMGIAFCCGKECVSTLQEKFDRDEGRWQKCDLCGIEIDTWEEQLHQDGETRYCHTCAEDYCEACKNDREVELPTGPPADSPREGPCPACRPSYTELKRRGEASEVIPVVIRR